AGGAARLPGGEERDRFGDRWRYTARRLLVVDLATGKVSHTFPGGKDVVEARHAHWEKVAPDALAFSADGSTLAVSAGGEIALVQTANGRKRLLAKGLSERLRLAFVGSHQLAAMLAHEK